MLQGKKWGRKKNFTNACKQQRETLPTLKGFISEHLWSLSAFSDKKWESLRLSDWPKVKMPACGGVGLRIPSIGSLHWSHVSHQGIHCYSRPVTSKNQATPRWCGICSLVLPFCPSPSPASGQEWNVCDLYGTLGGRKMSWARQHSMKRVGSGISLMGLILSSIFRAVASPENAFVYIRKGRTLCVGIALWVCGLASQSQAGFCLLLPGLGTWQVAGCSEWLTQLYMGAIYSFTIGWLEQIT